MDSPNSSYSRIGYNAFKRMRGNPGWKEVIHTWSVQDICDFLQTNTAEVKIYT